MKLPSLDLRPNYALYYIQHQTNMITDKDIKTDTMSVAPIISSAFLSILFISNLLPWIFTPDMSSMTTRFVMTPPTS
jgi:hypothetical protein